MESQREAEDLRRDLRLEACDSAGESARTGIARNFEQEARDDIARGIRAIPGSPAENAQESSDDYLAGVRLGA